MSDAVLAGLLTRIEANERNYPARYQLVLDALARAQRIGYQAGIRIDPQEPDWPVAYILLPMPDGSPGQVSWHLPRFLLPWDGHSTEEKYRRIHKYVEGERHNDRP